MGLGAGSGDQALTGDTSSPETGRSAFGGEAWVGDSPRHTHTYCHPVIEAATVPPGQVGLCCERVRKPRACPPSTLGREPP